METTLGKRKPISVSASTVIDLKAELLKKQEAYKATSKEPRLKRLKQVKKQVDREDREDREDEEMDLLKASYEALQRKAKLYDQKIQEADSDEEQLVDFLQKGIEAPKPIIKQQEQGWEEIIDEFGRSRLVRKSVDRMDQDTVHGVTKEEDEEETFKQEALNKHYDARKEVRELGVSNYMLSQDLETRKQQIERLKSLRKDTVQQRRYQEKLSRQRVDRLKVRKRQLEMTFATNLT